MDYKAIDIESRLPVKKKFSFDLTKIKVMIYIMNAKSQICSFPVS